MLHKSVVAVLVTYNPSADVLTNIAALCPQVGMVVVVDNGSGQDSLKLLRGARSKQNFRLIENSANIGIAAALNAGVREANRESVIWVALFDQDSTVGPDFIEALRQCYQTSADPSHVGIVSPIYVDARTGIDLPLPRSGTGHVVATPTSGSLIPLSVFDKVGMFNESLFMDYVDIEFSLRCRRAGYRILQSDVAILYHSMGCLTRHRICGRWFTTTNHSAARRYYITRNRLWLLACFIRDWSWWSMEIRRAIVETIKIILVEHDRCAKIKSIVLGCADAAGGRLGKRFEL